MKNTYTISKFQRNAATAVRVAETGVLVTITRRSRPVVHVISDERLGAIVETMDLLAEPRFAKELAKLRTGTLKFFPVSSLLD